MRWCRVAGLTLLVIVAADGAVSRPFARLRVVTDDGTLAWSAVVAVGDRFEVSFDHSAERCRWTQRYELDATLRVRQRDSVFPCYGAGMPRAAFDGSPVTWSPAGLVVGAPRVFDRIRMVNARTARIALQVRGSTIAIGDRLPDLAAFTVEVR